VTAQRQSPAGGPATVPPRLDGPLLRPDQAAELLAVKRSWIYEAVRTGELPCLRIGRHIRFTRAMLEEWLSTRSAAR
jgi:excisionase family DNA binding protein